MSLIYNYTALREVQIKMENRPVLVCVLNSYLVWTLKSRNILILGTHAELKKGAEFFLFACQLNLGAFEFWLEMKFNHNML